MLKPWTASARAQSRRLKIRDAMKAAREFRADVLQAAAVMGGKVTRFEVVKPWRLIEDIHERINARGVMDTPAARI